MYTCCVCRFGVDLDDVVLPTEGQRCICLGCYVRMGEVQRTVSKLLWRDVQDAVDSAARSAA